LIDFVRKPFSADLQFTRSNAGFDLFDDEMVEDPRRNNTLHASDYIIDIREYDVPYHVRVSIDKGIIQRSIHQRDLADIKRHPDWEMVHSRSQTRRDHVNLC
jgi:DNA polymerase elongation subunit (family B)